MQMIMIIIYTLISVGGVTLVKLGNQYPISIGIDRAQATFSIGWTTLCGMFLYVISFLIYMTLIARNNLTYITPVTTAFSYILTLFVSILVFHEQLTIHQWIGWFMILGGVVLMNVKK